MNNLNTKKPLKKKHLWLLVIGTLIVLSLFFLFKKDKPAVLAQTTPKIVKTLVISQTPQIQRRTFSGKVQSGDRVDLAFEVTGQLIEFGAKEGDLVKKGQILAKLNPRDYQNTLDQEKSRLKEISAQFARAQELIKRNVISQADYDKIKSDYDIAKNRVDTASKSLDDTLLKAPFEGQIGKKFVQNFQNIQAKQPIISLQNEKNLEIVIDVPERVVPNAQASGIIYNFYAVFEALPNEKIPLTLKSYGTQTDPLILTYPVTFSFPASLPALLKSKLNVLPGMLATVFVEYPSSVDLAQHPIQIPMSAIFVDENKNQHVWVIDQETMIVHLRPIKASNLSEENMHALDGLKEGEMIVIAGANSLREGMKVQVYTQNATMN